MGFDRFCQFGGPKMQLELTEVLDGSAVSGSGIHPGEDDIKVDRFSCKHVVPLHVGELRDSFSSEDFEFGKLKIEHVILDHFPCEFLARGEENVLS